MKKWLKITLSVIGIIILIFVIDLICIFTINRPLLAIRTDNDDSINIIYKGLFYDTYNCAEYSVPQIKSKGSKFSCAISRTDIGNVIEIVDTTKELKAFSCAEALEEFHEDENFTYYFNCIKGKYIIVKYESGYEEKISNALKHGSITINDLDNFNIDYIKQEKEAITKDDIITDNGLLFSIIWVNTVCIPIQLNIYDKGKYELFTSYESCEPNEICNSMLKYSESVKGDYNYDVIKIIQNSKADTTYTTGDENEYEIFAGNGEVLLTDDNNKYLEEILKQIDVNLKTCAKPDYN